MSNSRTTTYRASPDWQRFRHQPNGTAKARKRVEVIHQNQNLGVPDAAVWDTAMGPLWIGEVGWGNGLLISIGNASESEPKESGRQLETFYYDVLGK